QTRSSSSLSHGGLEPGQRLPQRRKATVIPGKGVCGNCGGILRGVVLRAVAAGLPDSSWIFRQDGSDHSVVGWLAPVIIPLPPGDHGSVVPFWICRSGHHRISNLYAETPSFGLEFQQSGTAFLCHWINTVCGR